MSTGVDEYMTVGDAVQYWLELEAQDSSTSSNRVLDDLEEGRQNLVDHKDPKINGHIDRMQLWLGMYDVDGSPRVQAELVSRVAFGALMFLSGQFRRLRYLQATNQANYYRRKETWCYPNSVNIGRLLATFLDSDGKERVPASDVVDQGTASIQTTQRALDVLFDRAPLDFGQDQSESTLAVRNEQWAWTSFLSKVLTNASQDLGLPLGQVPILEPKSISEAKPTTLSSILTQKTKN
ncbi:MAG TPA: hypothetical protein VL989_03350 [Candidatus Sulfotelmatobacter sp.]|nr:hypothetical protein [Candidatus Sulfotelmatobacter sp.]